MLGLYIHIPWFGLRMLKIYKKSIFKYNIGRVVVDDCPRGLLYTCYKSHVVETVVENVQESWVDLD